MYRTAVYRLVNGGITHQNQQISENSDDIAQQYNVMLLNITFFPDICCFWCV